MLRKATEGVVRHNVYTTVAACGLTLHRAFGFGQKRVLRALQAMDKLVFEADCFEQIREALRDEVGVDVKKMWDEKYGDREIRLVFIGQKMDRKEICDKLDNCLGE